MNKEKVFFDSAKKDLMKITFFHTRRFLIYTALLWAWFQLNVLILYLPPALITVIDIVFLSVLFIGIVIMTSYIFIIQTKRFTIISSTLSKKRNFKPRLTLLFFSVASRLSFNNGMHYIIRRNRYYTWSAAYIMNEDELFKTSCIDDSYTLITVGRKALIFYNDKLFDTSDIKYSK